MGAERSYLKSSLGPQKAVGDGRGQVVRYQGGAIYWTQATDAQALNAAALTAYLAAGGPAGPLGYPMADSGSDPEWTQRFRGGSIVKGPRTTPQAIWGESFIVWKRLGYGQGILGHPSGPRTQRPDKGWAQAFRNGCVTWGPRTRPVGVAGFIYLEWMKEGGADGPWGYPVSDTEQLPDGSWRGVFEGGTLTFPGPPYVVKRG
nr:hypothetical protein [Kineosphaera limosa]